MKKYTFSVALLAAVALPEIFTLFALMLLSLSCLLLPVQYK